MDNITLDSVGDKLRDYNSAKEYLEEQKRGIDRSDMSPENLQRQLELDNEQARLARHDRFIDEAYRGRLGQGAKPACGEYHALFAGYSACGAWV